jgi:hypothetical protein
LRQESCLAVARGRVYQDKFGHNIVQLVHQQRGALHPVLTDTRNVQLTIEYDVEAGPRCRGRPEQPEPAPGLPSSARSAQAPSHTPITEHNVSWVNET